MLDRENIIAEEIKTVFKDKNGNPSSCTYLSFRLAPFVSLKAEWDALLLSRRMGEILFERLIEYQKKHPEIISDDQLNKAQRWALKKSYYHPIGAYTEMTWISENKDFQNMLMDVGLSVEETAEKMIILALLHDMGRLSEINLETGKNFEFWGVKNKNHTHATESFEILNQGGVTDPLFLLPIKYHAVNYVDDHLPHDPLYIALNPQKKKQVDLLLMALRDADRMANLQEKSMFGIKKAGEINNPAFSGNYTITPKSLAVLKQKKQSDVRDEHTYLDALLRFMGWVFTINFPFYAKRIAAQTVRPLWDRIFEQAKDDWDENPTNPERYQETILQLIEAKNFVISQFDSDYKPIQLAEIKNGMVYFR